METEANDQKWWQSNYLTLSGSITFENILSLGVLEWLVVLVGCKIKAIISLRQENLKITLSDYAHYDSRG